MKERVEVFVAPLDDDDGYDDGDVGGDDDNDGEEGDTEK